MQKEIGNRKKDGKNGEEEEYNENLPQFTAEEIKNRLYRPSSLLTTDQIQLLESKAAAKRSETIDWYNDNFNPYENGLLYERTSETSLLNPKLDTLFKSLPVNLQEFLILLPKSEIQDEFLKGNLVERLVITLLNEEDNRIANLKTKRQVLYILNYLLKSFPTRKGKVWLRLMIQPIHQGWIDTVYEIGEDGSEEEKEARRKDYHKLFYEIKRFLCDLWRITDDWQRYLLQVRIPLFFNPLPSILSL